MNEDSILEKINVQQACLSLHRAKCTNCFEINLEFHIVMADAHENIISQLKKKLDELRQDKK